jgi:hypothetical protein
MNWNKINIRTIIVISALVSIFVLLYISSPNPNVDIDSIITKTMIAG